MKQGKKPTVAQKIWMSNNNLDPKEWLVVKWTPDSGTIIHRTTEEILTLPRQEG